VRQAFIIWYARRPGRPSGRISGFNGVRLPFNGVRLPEHALLVGDFNTGYSPVDAESGRHRNRAALEYTWYSRAKSGPLHGFRIDHAFASAPLLRRVRECRYFHEERESSASDHSALLVRVH
jgi:endonuclease/exonuclease/phosphatase family metal-dependent hydrolase